MSSVDMKERVKEHYGEAAHVVRCGAGASAPLPADPVSADLYDDGEAATVQAEALQASLGCGNPTALAELKEGDVVLDLGSGGGIDVLLSARRVGPSGKAYGLDMTDEMLALAEENKARSGLRNVEFVRGEIEDIPLRDAYLQLRDQPLDRQGPCARGGVPRPAPGWAVRDLGHRVERAAACGTPWQRGAVGRVP